MGQVLNFEKRRRERILKKISDKFCHPLFDVLPVRVGAMDYEGRYLGVNSLCGSSGGCTRAELISQKTIYDVVEPHDRERLKKIIELTIDEGECDWFQSNWQGRDLTSFHKGWGKLKAVQIDGVEMLLGIVLFADGPRGWGFTAPR